MEDQIVKFWSYLTSICSSTLEFNETELGSALEDPTTAGRVKAFFEDPASVMLVVCSPENSGGVIVLSDLSFDSVGAIAILFAKTVPNLSADTIWTSQIRFLHFSISTPGESLLGFVHSVFSPLLDSYLEKSKSGEVPGKKGLPDVIKRTKALELALRRVHQDADIPTVVMNIDPRILDLQKGSKSDMTDAIAKRQSLEEVGDYVSLIKKCTQDIEFWNAQCQKLISHADSTFACDTAEAEIDFWINLGNAVRHAKNQFAKPELHFMLDFMLKANGKLLLEVDEFQTTRTKLERVLAKVDDSAGINSIMRDFPLAALVSATSFPELVTAVNQIFQKLARVKFIKDYKEERLVEFLKLVGNDVTMIISKLLEEEILLPLDAFNQSFRENLNLPVREQAMTVRAKESKSVVSTTIFDVWAEKTEAFLTSLGLKVLQAFRHVKHLPIKDRAQEIYDFRKNHGRFWDALSTVQGTETSTAKNRLEEAYDGVMESDIITNISPDTLVKWRGLLAEYETQATACEQQIAEALKAVLKAARSSKDMFKTFRKFGPLIQRPKIHAAVLEYQSQLFNNITEDLNALSNKLKISFAESEVGRMCEIRDLPPRAASRMWFKQIRRQLLVIESRLLSILGEDWKQQPQGKKVYEKCARFHQTLAEICGTVEVDYSPGTTSPADQYTGLQVGRIFNETEGFIVEACVVPFGSRNKVFKFVPQVIGNLTMTINFDPLFIETFKEVRNFEFQHFKFMNPQIKTKSILAKETSVYAFMLKQAVQSYQSIVTTKINDSNQTLLAKLISTIQTSFRKIADLEWEQVHEDPDVARDITSLCKHITDLEKRCHTLQVKSREIREIHADLETCPLSVETFTANASALQKIVDQVNEQNGVNTKTGSSVAMDQWVEGLNNGLQRVLRSRLERAIGVWTGNFAAMGMTRQGSKQKGISFVGEEKAVESQGMTRIPVSRVLIKFKQGKIRVEPPVVAIKAAWLKHFTAMCTAISRVPMLTVDNTILSVQTPRTPAQVVPSLAVNGTEKVRTFKYLFDDIQVALTSTVFSQTEKAISRVEEYVDSFLRYQSLWDLEEDTITRRVGDNLDQWNRLLQSVKATKKSIRQLNTQRVIGPVVVDTNLLCAHIRKRTVQWHGKLLRRYAERIKRHTLKTKEEINLARDTLEKFPEGGTQEAIALLAELKAARSRLLVWEEEIEELKSGQAVLESEGFRSEEWVDVEQAQGEFDSYTQIVARLRAKFDSGFEDLKFRIIADAERLARDISALGEDWQKDRPFNSRSASEGLQTIAMFQQRLTYLREEKEKITYSQEALDLPIFASDELGFIKTEMDELQGVWKQLEEVFEPLEAIQETNWGEANPKRIRSSLQDIHDSLKRLPNHVRQYEAWAIMSSLVEDRIAVNKLLVELKSDAIKPKYWTQIKEGLGTNWTMKDLTVGDLWAVDLLAKEHVLRDVFRVAQGEAALEQFLNEIKDAWQAYELELTMYQKKCWLIKGWNDLFEALAKDISSLDDMRKSPFFKPFEEEAKAWDESLSRARDAFDVWLDVQRQFVYLEGIFYGSAEIKVQLPEEFKSFRVIENEFVGLMRKVTKRPQVLNVASIENLHVTLDTLFSRLNKVQKALGEYLEKQRQRFCRFYFIGDEDLLEIIGSSADPSIVQKHLPKMFAGITNIVLSEDLDSVSGMISREGERVEFITPITELKNSTIIGWLTKLESEMQMTLAHLLAQSMAEVQTLEKQSGAGDKERLLDWMRRFPAQVVLLSIQVLWSRTVEEALGQGSVTGLKSALAVIQERLNLLSDTVLQSLDAPFRKQLEQILTELVHQKDVVVSLIEDGVNTSTDFKWLYQMRFEWNDQETNPLRKLAIKVANASFFYGFEYLGVSEKLVQTDLTDNIYLTLTQALHAKLGGCPYGPAGTGKTETVKMLGAQLGRFVLTFNCDESFDFNSMGRIFLGLCQVGAWGCFDEFNRLEERMLSAVSQQILTIQSGLRTKDRHISLLGRNLQLHESTGIFITMNPGYAGRSNLPDNLKQLFRNMACTAPDKDKIASVMLYTRGFRTAETLSGKIVLLFKLCEAQLSTQPHYDFGLRALKSVLNSAGSLKRKLLESRQDTLTEDADIAKFETEVLIQSIYDTVVPKLVAEDVSLLSSLVRDVFPGIRYQRFIEEELKQAVMEGCKQRYLVTTTSMGDEGAFMEKIWQLYQIQKLHHGLMLVGSSGCGKSTALEVLIRAMEQVEKTKYDTYVVNPKAISKDELYGVLDSTTMEWTDGVFTSILRTILNNQRGEMERQHWIVLDGDVDPEWVENLNSVLDDNKLLTLPNGERLAIPPNLHICFEVENLKYATLATVSRCGMVWFSDNTLQHADIFRNYLDTLLNEPVSNIPEDTHKEALDIQSLTVREIERYFAEDGVVIQCLKYCDTLEHVMQSSRMRSINSVWALLTQGVRHVIRHHGTGGAPLSESQIIAYMKKRLVFALIFGFGGDLSLSGRYEIADYVYEAVSDIPLPAPAKPQGKSQLGRVSLIDYEVRVEDSEWHTWAERVPVIEVEPAKCVQSDVVITTVDTIRNTEIAQSWLAENMPMIFCGPPGSGKTMTLTSTLSSATDVELVGINFSAGTTPALIFQIFQQYCEVKRGPSGLIMRPKSADQRLVIFCDEINLPANDAFGTQRVITFIQQLVAQGGFWRASDKQFVKLNRIQFVGACNPPTDPGRVIMTDRFLRYAPVLLVDYPSEISMKQIYGTFTRALLRLQPHLEKYGDAFTNAMVEIYLTSQRRFTADMQAHYIYSPRELSRYIRAMYEAVIQYDRMSVEDMIRLFCHEGLRLFYDRLIEDESRQFCDELIDSVSHKYFSRCNLNEALQRPILFTSWLTKRYESVQVEELREFVRFRMKVFYEEELNVQLVAYDDLLHHALRVDRVLKQPMGHALLIGISGCGKSTLARFVAWMNGYSLFRIKVSNSYKFEHFENDLRIVMKRAGCKGEEICWIFDEMSALGPAMIERMNALLASGEVPGLFEGDDHAALMSDCRAAAQREGWGIDSDELLFKHFTRTVQRNLHIVFTMNPAGTEVAGATQSPALFNRCVVDWVGTWSDQAVNQVTVEFTNFMDLSVLGPSKPYQVPEREDGESSGMEDVADAAHATCVQCLTTVHSSVHSAAQQIMKQNGRYNYITPRSLLDVISHFTKIFVEKSNELKNKQLHLNVGIQKLEETQSAVAEMQIELAEKQKVLEEQNRKAEEKLRVLVKDQDQAERTRQEVSEIAVKVAERNEEVEGERAKVKEELAEVEPLVEEAKSAVTSIRKQNLDEVRALPKPPALVKSAMEMVGLMLGETNISWDNLRKVMRRDDFIPGIINFDSESLDPKVRAKLEKDYFNDPNFNFESVNRASKACGPLVKWGEAQIRYTEILRTIEPLTTKIAALEIEAKQLESKKEELDSALRQLEETVVRLKSEYAELVAKAESIRQDMTHTQEKVDRSVKMLSSLGSESVRWGEERQAYLDQQHTIVGDSMIAAAFITYAGFFDQLERISLRNRWFNIFDQHGLPFRESLNVRTFLTHTDQVHTWLASSLPNDELCIENAAILSRYNRFPLIIDPSGQSVDFLMKHYAEQKIVKTSFLDDGFVKSLESAVRFGGTLLVQDVENLDPILNPLLNKEITRSGGRSLVPIGHNDVDYNPAFMLYLVTRDPNPLFGPDICSRVTFVNFSVTQSSLETQCINRILKSQSPAVEKQRADLVAAQGELAVRLSRLEVKLLDELSNAEGNLLENVPLIATLETVKKEAAEVQAKSADNEMVMITVNQSLERFRSFAVSVRRVFFTLESMSSIHFLYQFSLHAFMRIVESTLNTNHSTEEVVSEDKLKEVQRVMLKNLFDYFSMSLHKADYIVLAFRICQIALEDSDSPIHPSLLELYLKGSSTGLVRSTSTTGREDAKEAAESIAASLGLDVLQKHQLAYILSFPEFGQLPDNVEEDPSAWQEVMSAADPENILPSSWISEEHTSAISRGFIKLIACKVLRPDRVAATARDYVNLVLGDGFISPAAGPQLAEIVISTPCTQPIVLASAPGFDVSNRIEELAVTTGSDLRSFAMGTGEAANQADKALPSAAKEGGWVMLKNVHLDPTYLTHLSKTLARLNAHEGFRLFLTSEISPKLPKTLLHQSRLLMNEAPGGMKASVLRTLAQVPAERAEMGPPHRLRLYFLFAWLHAVIQERIRYAPVGWSQKYEFGEPDRRGSLDMLDEWLGDSPENISWPAIRTLMAQSTYGGRIGNYFDQVLLISFLDRFLCPSAMSSDFGIISDAANRNSTISLPNLGSWDEYKVFVANLPTNESPVWFGLPPLAERMIASRQAEQYLSRLLKLGTQLDAEATALTGDFRADTTKSMKSETEAGEVKQTAWYKLLELQLSKWLDQLQEASVPSVHETEALNANPMFRCFNRELKGFARLRNVITAQLKTLQSIGEGHLKATAQHRQLVQELQTETVPGEYKRYSGVPLPISEWLSDFANRQKWIFETITSNDYLRTNGVWLGGLMTPEAFVTATRQSVAQKLGVSLQEIELQIDIGVTEASESGFTVKGMVMEGAEFHDGKFRLSTVITNVLPPSRLSWHLVSEGPNSGQGCSLVDVPVYLNSDRQELVFSARLALPDSIAPEVWYQRGIALVLWTGIATT